MAELVAVLGAFETALTATKQVYAVIQQVKKFFRSPKEIEAISTQISLSEGALLEMQKSYTALSSGNQSIFNRLLQENVDKYRELVKYIAKNLDTTNREDSTAWDRKLAFAKAGARWLIKESWIKGQLEAIHQYEDAFQKILVSINTKDTQKMTVDMKVLQRTTDELKDIVNLSRFRSSIEKLPRADVEEKRTENRKSARRSQPGWVLEKHLFQEWSTARSPHRWLWAVGEPGSGKTCIASFVADYLQDTLLLDDSEESLATDEYHAWQRGESNDPGSDMTGTALFYGVYNAKNPQDATRIIKCLLRQLLDQLWDLSPLKAYRHVEAVDRLVSGLGRGGYSAKNLLETVSEDFNRVFLIIDALDEIPSSFGDLLQQLKLTESPSLKIFCTARSPMKKDGERLGALVLDVNENTETIRKYAYNRISSIVEVGSGLSEHIEGEEYVGEFYVGDSALARIARNETERHRIANKIVDTARGNFLCAVLQINALVGEETDEVFETTLENLSNKVDDLVRLAIDRIALQPVGDSGDNREIGKEALRWVIYARKPLKVVELQYAIAYTIHGGDRRSSPDNIAPHYSAQHLQRTTRYFLQIDEATMVTVHKTVRDFCFDNPENEKRHFGDANTIIARACLQFISRARVLYRTKEDWDKAVRDLPFLEYAATNWGWHMDRGNESLLSQGGVDVLRLLKDSNFLACMTVALQPTLKDLGIWDEAMWEKLKKRDGSVFEAMHFMAWFGLSGTMLEWLSRLDEQKRAEEVDRPSWTKDQASNNSGYSALWIACLANQPTVVDVLLDHGADPRRLNGNRAWTGLSAAARRGHLGVVKSLLLHADADKLIRQPNHSGRLPLADAACSGNLDVVDAILYHVESMPDHKQLLLSKDDAHRTALHEAAERTVGGNGSVVKRLIESGAGDKGMLEQHTAAWQDTPLHIASHGNEHAVAFLLEAGADTAAQQSQGKTPLHLALQKPFLETASIVELLVPKTDLTLRDTEKGRTFFHTPAEYGRPRQIKLLLKQPQMPHDLLWVKDKDGSTPLLRAARTRHGNWRRCVVFLLEAMDGKNIEMDHAREIYRTLLKQRDPSAAEELSVLLRYYDDPSALATGTRGRTMLHEVAVLGDVSVVKAIITRYGTRELEISDVGGKTPLVLAASHGRTDVVRYLLSIDANVNAQGGLGRTALHWAVELDDPALADIVLRHNPDQDLKTKSGQTALGMASARSRVRRLNEKSARDTHEVECVKTESARARVISQNPGGQDKPALMLPCKIVIGDQRTRGDVLPSMRDNIIGVGQGEFLETDPIPVSAKIPLSRIDVHITGADQGWSLWEQGHKQDRGTYRGSITWYDLGIKRDGRLVRQVELTRNALHVGLRTYHGVWDLDGGHLELPGEEPLSRWWRPQDYQEVRDFVRFLRPGDRVVVLGRAKDWGWTCLIAEATVSVYYED